MSSSTIGAARLEKLNADHAMRKCDAKRDGWSYRKVKLRPNTRLLTVLSLGWILISPEPARLLATQQVESASLPGMLCWLLVLLHPVFISMALVFRLKEKPKVFRQTIPDANYDLRHVD